MRPCYVRTDDGVFLVQIYHDGVFGFALADDDQVWPGGIGAASSWEVVPETEVPEDVRRRLGWLLQEFGD